MVASYVPIRVEYGFPVLEDPSRGSWKVPLEFGLGLS